MTLLLIWPIVTAALFLRLLFLYGYLLDQDWDARYTYRNPRLLCREFDLGRALAYLIWPLWYTLAAPYLLGTYLKRRAAKKNIPKVTVVSK